MYVCMHVCMYLCMYVCMYIQGRGVTFINRYCTLHTYMHTYIHTYMELLCVSHHPSFFWNYQKNQKNVKHENGHEMTSQGSKIGFDTTILHYFSNVIIWLCQKHPLYIKNDPKRPKTTQKPPKNTPKTAIREQFPEIMGSPPYRYFRS